MQQKKIGLTLIFILFSGLSFAQENRVISLQECLDRAVENYPIYQQYQLQTQKSELQMKNNKSDLYPQIALNGKATYQNKVIELPFVIPNVSIPSMSKDQYRLSLDINQPIYRGGLLKQQQQQEVDALAISDLQVDKALYDVKSQTKALFFRLALADKQKQIVLSYQETLQNKQEELLSLVKEGVVLESDLNVIKLEVIKAEQELYGIDAARIALIQNLNELTNMNLESSTEFSLPEVIEMPEALQSRFEYSILTQQQNQLENTKDLLSVKNRPRLFAFASGGIGRPGLNMLSNNLDDFFLAGINLQWNLWDWNKTRNDKKRVDINKEIIETQKQAFELNVQMGLNQIMADIKNEQNLINQDPEILSLQENVTKTAEAQFKNGTLKSSDYVLELQKLKQVRLNNQLHRISLLNSQLAYIEMLGKL